MLLDFYYTKKLSFCKAKKGFPAETLSFVIFLQIALGNRFF